MSETYRLGNGPLSSLELMKAVDHEAAQKALRELNRSFESLAFTAPEVYVERYDDVVRHIIELAAAMRLFDKTAAYKKALTDIVALDSNDRLSNTELMETAVATARNALNSTREG